MTMSIVQIGYGKVNYDVSSATLTSFVVEQPFDRVLASKALSKSSQTQRLPSSDTPNINGWLYHDTLNAPDGTIILVQMQARSHGLSVRDGSVFLRVRDGGPMMLIIAKFEINIRSSQYAESHVAFSGCADILQASELSEYGITPSNRYIDAFMSQDEIDECFDIQELSTGSPKPVRETVVNASGESVTFTTQRITRRIRIRK